MRKIIKGISAGVCALMLGTAGIATYFNINLPNNYNVEEGKTLVLENAPLIKAVKKTEDIKIASSIQESSETMDLKLFGLIDVKKVQVNKIQRPNLTPGGTPFGLKMMTDGIVVINLGEVNGYDGIINPAEEAGIKVGDIIKTVNGIKVNSNKEIASAVQTNENITKVELEREGKPLNLEVIPIKSKLDNVYRIGVWVRDSTAGIGTLTYFDKKTMNFGGLGHAVCDVDTGFPLPLLTGEVVSVAISDVIKGYSGSPGELSGSFLSKAPIGNIKFNTQAGVFGTMDYTPTDNKEIPMAFKQEITVGPAKIYTTLEGTTPKEYDVLIEKINYDYDTISKNMVIKIIDTELLSRSGGIVQGMSGSPIIQNGKLAGAVTHVFVNDPTRGFGIFSENMYDYSNVVLSPAA